MKKHLFSRKIILFFLISVFLAFVTGYFSAKLMKDTLSKAKREKIQGLVEVISLNISQITQQAKDSTIDQQELQVKLNNLINNLPSDDGLIFWATDKDHSFVILPLKPGNSNLLEQQDKNGNFVVKDALNKINDQNSYSFEYVASPDVVTKTTRAIHKASYIKNIPNSEVIFGCETSLEDVRVKLNEFIFKFAICATILLFLQILILYKFFTKQDAIGNDNCEKTINPHDVALEINRFLVQFKSSNEANPKANNNELINKSLQEAMQQLKIILVNYSLDYPSSNIESLQKSFKVEINRLYESLAQTLDLIKQQAQHNPASIIIKEIENLLARLKAL